MRVFCSILDMRSHNLLLKNLNYYEWSQYTDEKWNGNTLFQDINSDLDRVLVWFGLSVQWNINTLWSI